MDLTFGFKCPHCGSEENFTISELYMRGPIYYIAEEPGYHSSNNFNCSEISDVEMTDNTWILCNACEYTSKGQNFVYDDNWQWKE